MDERPSTADVEHERGTEQVGHERATASAPKPMKPVLNRRTVLATATAAGLGVAAARLIALGNERAAAAPITGTLGNKLGLDWVSPLENESARVAHLLRRATLGVTAAELEQARSDGYAKTVDRLLETPFAEPPELLGGDTASVAKPLNVGQMQMWWLDHMLTTPTPFAEKMTLFWHGHFTSDVRKVGPQSPYMYWQNLTWRRIALADLRTMLMQVTIDPAMLRYLDLGNSTGRNPNENYARELMELFTMGAETFTEDDVKAASKALAGWREPQTQAMIDAQLARAMQRGNTPRQTPKADTVKTGVFEAQRAYRGPAYAFLGETKLWNTELLLDRILAQPATAPFIVRRVVVNFVTPMPADSYVARLAESFRRSRYSVKQLMHDVFTSPEFVAPSAYRALIKSPIEYMVGIAKVLGENPQTGRLILGSGQAMGQTLFDPPSVGGWPENESWISSNTMLGRANFVTGALGAGGPNRRLPSAANAHETYLDGVLSAQTLKLLNEVNDDRRRWAIVFASPEFQLK